MIRFSCSFLWFMIRVTFGEHDRCNETVRPETRFVLRAFVQDFSFTNFDKDIAILRLNDRVPITDFIRPICLPDAEGELLWQWYYSRYLGYLFVSNVWPILIAGKYLAIGRRAILKPFYNNLMAKSFFSSGHRIILMYLLDWLGPPCTAIQPAINNDSLILSIRSFSRRK